MDFEFETSLFEEYRELKAKLLNNSEVLELVDKRNKLHKTLCEVDQYSSKYANLKQEYDIVANQLAQNDDYSNFKYLERELNLFVLYCNKELEKLFGLAGKGCGK